MRLLGRVLAALMVALPLTGAAATASGPPVANETLRFVDEPFGGATFNCGTGNLALSDGVFSGVIRTLVKPDGTVTVSAHTRGTDSLDDFDPVPDGSPDATTTFVFNSVDSVFSSGLENHTFSGNGTLTVVASGEQLRFHVVLRMLIGADGEVTVGFERVTCD